MPFSIRARMRAASRHILLTPAASSPSTQTRSLAALLTHSTSCNSPVCHTSSRGNQPTGPPPSSGTATTTRDDGRPITSPAVVARMSCLMLHLFAGPLPASPPAAPAKLTGFSGVPRAAKLTSWPDVVRPGPLLSAPPTGAGLSCGVCGASDLHCLVGFSDATCTSLAPAATPAHPVRLRANELRAPLCPSCCRTIICCWDVESEAIDSTTPRVSIAEADT